MKACLYSYSSVCSFMLQGFNFISLHRTYLHGAHNVIADAIFRDYISLLFSLVPQAQQTSVPTHVQEFLLSPPDWGLPNWITRFRNSLPTACP